MPGKGAQPTSVHAGHRDRIKAEFLVRGMEGWPDHRVLELLLFYAIPQKDVNTLAHSLIEQFGSLQGVFDASVDELKKVKGVGESTAILLRMIPELSGRYNRQREEPGRLITCVELAVRELQPYFYGARNEMVYILCVDAKGKAQGVRKVSEGSIHASDINIRRIAEEAMGLRAAGLYLAHNHVSNLAFPSAADWQSTDIIRTALAPLGIELLDHIVFVDGDAVSMSQSEQNGRRPMYQMF